MEEATRMTQATRRRRQARWGGLLVGLVCALGLAACGGSPAAPANAAGADLADLSYETEALAEIGFATDVADLRLAAAPDPSASARVGRKGEDRKLRKLRLAFGRHTLHAEATVQTKAGVQTLVVQRGEVTAVNDTSVTVKSADGFSLTWTFSAKLRIAKRGAPGGQAERSELKPGVTVGVAGLRDGSTTTARLVVIPVANAPK
jgi:hypothetical protein